MKNSILGIVFSAFIFLVPGIYNHAEASICIWYPNPPGGVECGQDYLTFQSLTASPPSPYRLGVPITWVATARDGLGSYPYTCTWVGEGFSGDSCTQIVTYTTSGSKTVSVTVHYGPYQSVQ